MVLSPLGAKRPQSEREIKRGKTKEGIEFEEERKKGKSKEGIKLEGKIVQKYRAGGNEPAAINACLSLLPLNFSCSAPSLPLKRGRISERERGRKAKESARGKEGQKLKEKRRIKSQRALLPYDSLHLSRGLDFFFL